MNREHVIDLQLIDPDGAPVRLANVSVSIDFQLNEKHRYGFRLGPTDANGHLRITYDAVEERRLRNLAFQPWDYRTRLEECDPTIQLSVPSQSELDSAVRIATSFNLGVTPPEAAWWPDANNRQISCEPVTVSLDSQHLSVRLTCRTL